jgi:hypothetical protein
MDALGKFLTNRGFLFNDFTISNRSEINAIGVEWVDEACEAPNDVTRWDGLLPKMDVWLEVSSTPIFAAILTVTRYNVSAKPS